MLFTLLIFWFWDAWVSSVWLLLDLLHKLVLDIFRLVTIMMLVLALLRWLLVLFWRMVMVVTHGSKHHFTCLRLQHAAKFYLHFLANAVAGVFYHHHCAIV